ncbi:MAG: MotA/TolQ/ExbB proton channel family protein [Gammaproteobacteria bacterium]
MNTERAFRLLIGAFVGVITVALMDAFLPETAAIVLLDKGGAMPPYPFSVQNLMWLAFSIGLAELSFRFSRAALERSQVSMGYLPESHDTVLLDRDMGTLYNNVKDNPLARDCALPQMIVRTVLQFQSTRSVEQASTVLASSLDLFMHEIDLRYALTRYIVWLIPSLGFIGTVIGIAIALNYAGLPGSQGADNLLEEVTRRLAVAFNTTLIALLQAAVLVFVQTFVQSREERAINEAGQYCLDNLINRLYVRQNS